MARNLFSVAIFIIVLRETLEAAVIVSVLLGLVEQIVQDEPEKLGAVAQIVPDSPVEADGEATLGSGLSTGHNSAEGRRDLLSDADNTIFKKRLIRKLRLQIFFGAGSGLLISLAIGAAFIAIWFTQASDLWVKAENLWEGIFELIASLMIFVMGVTMLKMDRAKAKWRVKLQRAFGDQQVDRGAKTGKWVLFILPLITVLREGIEAVVFVGGVSLGQSGTSIPIAAITGLLVGVIIGFLIYHFASRMTLTVFLIVMTNFILLIGAGLFSKAVWYFQDYKWTRLLGINGDDSGGDGPGSYDVRGNVWQIDCCDPNGNQGWSIFNAILGWQNTATLGSVLSYVFYWLAVAATLSYMKFKEGRTTFLGRESAAGVRRRRFRERAMSDSQEKQSSLEREVEIASLPL
ncbi:hypothetical protein SERLA73DRAFT_174969 [Serpula lacrymans var. lacrymans S7.3]|uniref:Iron permease FTR1 n=2 Tax=Serpula lacrymans var. lacrymans TaxID=341189 RepID=F8PJQ8_SERL3|nr:secreted iron permease FTR1 [Serpula lacrymans var. lacrymans S7.9]EGO03468.1 hypothetical protein SERLA73DRAFT_174969 [Serpula lacrymans var. lacrymans S7.3]EGO29228.1 secreted iron permease FTR1 [Serpula lacrymans var. lacrymans S7.9]